MAYEALYTRGRPKTLSQLVGQEHISNALARAISNGRLSHAYLLVGTRGTGKTSTARLLSKAMNCERVHEAQEEGRPLDRKEIPCNKCDSCKNFDSSPDNLEFDAASNRSVEDVTRLLASAYLAPLRARVKTFIIDEVHMLSFEAVNSILKLIEEPPPNVAFFLATTELNKVPMTIRSRCQVLNFRLIPQAKIAPYLLTLAQHLNVTLQEEAAKKIARLAEGSMRDALTYLDQCYAMSDKEITLADVNETLGLISDENLDDVIAAVKSKDRATVGKAITQAFRSGLSANVIAESLITRLRDMEFEMLARGEKNFSELDRIIDALRSATNEMYGSGIPDIIFEMALMKLTAPAQNFVAMPAQPSTNEKLDDWKKIFYDVKNFLNEEDIDVSVSLAESTVTGFANNTLTLSFKKNWWANMFRDRHLADFEREISKIAKRKIKISVLIDENLLLEELSEPAKKNLFNAKAAFDASDFTKV